MFEIDKSRKAHLKCFIVYDGFTFSCQLKCVVEKMPL